jgi:DNA-binding GntR family transcriptional regulator
MIDPDSDRPRHRQLADSLRARIASGEFAPGARLPSEAYLSQETGLHRTTVRKAMEILRTEGLIEIRRPKGTFVREQRPEDFVEVVRGNVVRARMPTPEERRQCDVSEGVPVLEVERAGGRVLYAGDHTALRVR